ncbi:MAG: L-threonylcarbamoyladenylate synthase [Anaerolineales bacterium]|jgi:L-threonylcarbamoyladenylate synthase
MKTEIIHADHPVALTHAADILTHGGLVAFPTDTVYGLAVLPFQAEYVERLYIAKGRNSDRAIAVLLGDDEQLEQVAKDIGETARRWAKEFWPGPLTLIVPSLETIPKMLTSQPNLGIRIPDHPVALALLRLVGPLAVTSANLSGQANTNTAQEVFEQLDGRIHLILDGGRTPGGVPSTVVDCTVDEPVILRQGPLTMEDLKRALS